MCKTRALQKQPQPCWFQLKISNLEKNFTNLVLLKPTCFLRIMSLMWEFPELGKSHQNQFSLNISSPAHSNCCLLNDFVASWHCRQLNWKAD